MDDPNLQLLETAARLLEPMLAQELVNEVLSAPQDVRSYIQEKLAKLLTTNAFVDALPGFLPPDEANQARLPVLRERLEALTSRA